MDKKEITQEEKQLLETIETSVKKLVDESKAQTVSTEDFKSKMTEIEGKLDGLKENAQVKEIKTTVDELKEQFKAQGIEITKLGQVSKKEETPKSLTQAVKEFFDNPSIKEYVENGAKGNSIRTKVAVDMTMATAITRPTTPYTQLLGGQPVYAPERKISMTDIISTGSTESETVTYNEEYNFVDGVSTLSENQSTAQSSFMVRPKTLTAGRIGTYLIVSKRMLKNEKYLMSHIASRIPQKIKKAEDTQILLGDGTGTNLTGLTTNASAFAAGSFAAAIERAQEYDALIVAISQLTQGEYEASGIVLNPIDATKIELLKDTTGKYLAIVRGADGVLRVGGLPVVETTAMTAGKFLVGDFRMACEFLYFTPLAMSISDSHASLFLTNEVCINFEEEPVFPIYNPLMFIYGTFSTAIAAIDKAT